VKLLEKQLAAAEEARNKMQETLEAEREEVRRTTTPRTLTIEEKAECKACVQALFASAKEIAGLRVEDGTSDADVQAAAHNITQSSQEQLYQSVQGMNKNILVELCIALGGLVQSMYIEREKAKIEEANRAAKKASKVKVKSDEVEEGRKKFASDTGLTAANTHSLVLPAASNSQSSYSLTPGSVPTVMAAPRPGSPSSPLPSTPISPVSNALLSPSAIAPGSGILNASTTSLSKQSSPSPNANAVTATTASTNSIVAPVSTPPLMSGNLNSSLGSSSQSVTVYDSSTALGRSPNQSLTVEQRQLLTTGAQFTKVSRGMFGAKHNRWVQLSDDLRSIIWKSLKGDQDKKSPSTNLLELYTT
jgi:hypothetical protein